MSTKHIIVELTSEVGVRFRIDAMPSAPVWFAYFGSGDNPRMKIKLDRNDLIELAEIIEGELTRTELL